MPIDTDFRNIQITVNRNKSNLTVILRIAGHATVNSWSGRRKAVRRCGASTSAPSAQKRKGPRMQCRPAGLMRYAAPPCRPKRPTTAPASRAQLWVFSTQPIFWNRNATRMSVLITSQKWGQECLTSVVRWFRRNSFHLNHLDKGRPT